MVGIYVEPNIHKMKLGTLNLTRCFLISSLLYLGVHFSGCDRTIEQPPVSEFPQDSSRKEKEPGSEETSSDMVVNEMSHSPKALEVLDSNSVMQIEKSADNSSLSISKNVGFDTPALQPPSKPPSKKEEPPLSTQVSNGTIEEQNVTYEVEHVPTQDEMVTISKDVKPVKEELLGIQRKIPRPHDQDANTSFWPIEESGSEHLVNGIEPLNQSREPGPVQTPVVETGKGSKFEGSVYSNKSPESKALELSVLICIVLGATVFYLVRRSQTKVFEYTSKIHLNEQRHRNIRIWDVETNIPPSGRNDSEPNPKFPHDVLGVSPGATREEIRQAYREKSKQYHPDKTSGEEIQNLDNEKMKTINEAYQSLINQCIVRNLLDSD